MKAFYQRHFLVFGKTQMTAAAATACDFLLLALLVEILGMYYVVAVAFASAFGGVVNFLLNRRWTFNSNAKVRSEALRYFFVSGGSLLLNTVLVWAMTEMFSWSYMISKASVVLVVGFAWNYPMQRYWVFQVKSPA